MSTIQAPPGQDSHATASASPPAPAPATPVGRRIRLRPGKIIAAGLVVAAVAVGLPAGTRWVEYRHRHSITNDAFVESHIVNVAPQLVSGRIVRFLAGENDLVSQGQIVAEVDPIPYRDKVNISRAQLELAQSELARQRADLDRVRKEVPIQIEIAKRTFAAAIADRGRAEESLKYTRDEVEKGIDEARAGVKAAQASLTLAELEYARFTRLEQQGASTQQRQQQVTQSRDSASAQVDLAHARMAKALAARTQIDVAAHAAGGRAKGGAESRQGHQPRRDWLRRDP